MSGTLVAALNYGNCLVGLKRFEEAQRLLCTTALVACRVLGDPHDLTLRMRWNFATALYMDPGATIDDLCEAVVTLEEAEQIARRVLGRAHPDTAGIEMYLRMAREKLRARETPSTRA